MYLMNIENFVEGRGHILGLEGEVEFSKRVLKQETYFSLKQSWPKQQGENKPGCV